MKRCAAALAGIAMLAWAAPTIVRAQATPPKKAATRKAPTAATHKKWMNDASDLQEELRDELQSTDGAKAAAAATKIEALMARTQTYWAGKRMEDVVKLAQDSRTYAKQVATAAKAGHLDEAKTAFGKMNDTCNVCHDLHPEKREKS